MIGIHITNGAHVAALGGVDLSMDWTGAACAGIDPEVWFPDQATGGTYATARGICDTCPIRERCLDYAMDREARLGYRHRAGMWGGKTPEERAAMVGKGKHRPTPLPADVKCGTDAGYLRHVRHHRPPCDACRLAHNEAERARQAARRAG